MGRWSEARVGDTFGPLEFHLTPELHRRYAESTHQEPTELIDPTVAGNLAIWLLASRYPGSIIHSHQDLEFFAPVHVGETVSGRGSLSLKEMRRDKAYVAIECNFERDGEPVWWSRMTCVWPEVHLGASGGRRRVERGTSGGPPATTGRDVMEISKLVTQDDMTLYSGEGNIHSDLEAACRAGLDATVAQGMMTLAYASALMTKIHGPAWLERGEIAVKFIGLVYAGDTITVSTRGEEVWAVNQDGRTVMAGEVRLRT